MNQTIKKITTTAVLLSICVVGTLFKNASIFITGPIVNAALVIAVLYCGIGYAAILGIITPITSFLITGSPIMAALPAMFPLIMLGNIIYILAIGLLKNKLGKKVGLPLSIVIGSVLKAAFMGITISLILLPNFLPESFLPKLSALQFQFSIAQLLTALIGGVYAILINVALLALQRKKTNNE